MYTIRIKLLTYISNLDCIPRLVKGQRALCSFSNADLCGGGNFTKLYGHITWNGTELHLEGTYLIQLSEDSCNI